jgi:hypothetical protein
MIGLSPFEIQRIISRPQALDRMPDPCMIDTRHDLKRRNLYLLFMRPVPKRLSQICV